MKNLNVKILLFFVGLLAIGNVAVAQSEVVENVKPYWGYTASSSMTLVNIKGYHETFQYNEQYEPGENPYQRFGTYIGGGVEYSAHKWDYLMLSSSYEFGAVNEMSFGRDTTDGFARMSHKFELAMHYNISAMFQKELSAVQIYLYSGLYWGHVYKNPTNNWLRANWGGGFVGVDVRLVTASLYNYGFRAKVGYGQNTHRGDNVTLGEFTFYWVFPKVKL